MKRLTFLFVAVAAVCLMFYAEGCSSGGSGGGGATVGGPGTGTTGTGTGTGTTGNGGGGTYTGGDTTNDALTGMFTADDMFNEINRKRQMYATHGGYGDYPWQAGHGDGTQNIQPWTWPVTMKWDDDLAKEAQDEAERIRDGGSPNGQRFAYQNGSEEAFWGTGLDTPKYMISARSYEGTDHKQYSYDYRWWSEFNGTAREGIFYQTGMTHTAHDCKTKLGVGKADLGANDVWWVLIFGE